MTDEQIVHNAETGTLEYIGVDVPVLYERIDHVLEIVREIEGRTIVGVRLSARLADAVQPAAGEGGLRAALENLAREMRHLLKVNPKKDGGLYRQRLDEAEAALSTSVPAGVVGWQPMDSAPLDGKHCILAIQSSVFVYSAQGAYTVLDGKPCWLSCISNKPVEPLAWMPNVLLPDHLTPWKNGAAAAPPAQEPTR